MLSPQLSRHPYLTAIFAFTAIITIILFVPWPNRSQRLLSSLSPFHTSTTTTTPPISPQWLLAIFLSPSSLSRRAIIRSTWATRYPSPSYEYRFILGNYSSSPWAPAIDAENATHGDIWAIEDFMHEDHYTANHNKNMEFFTYMVRHQGTRVRRYEYVSKVDDDNWFNIPPFYDTFIAPRLPGGEKRGRSNLTMIGRPMVWGQPYAYASGRIYTVSWPLLEFFAEKYAAHPEPEKTEDEIAGLYLYENKTQHEFVPVELEQAWDIGLEYLVNNETMLIHSIKDDERLLEISTMFDARGKWNGKQIPGLTTYNRTMKEVVERIGEPSPEEVEQLRKGWENEMGGDPKETLDWKLIQQKISIEDREEMGNMFPLNLPGNNASSGVVPQRLGKKKRPEENY